MAREGNPEWVIPLREQRTLNCYNCSNNNLLHNLTLAKASKIGMVGGPGSLPQFIGERWAVYYCIACESFFPYPKTYAAQPQIRDMYQQILNWCISQCELRKQRNAHLERLVSIIESNQDLLGLPGQREDNLEKSLKPITDRMDSLEREIRVKKGGRPKHCKEQGCKTKAEIDDLCRAHFLEKNNE
jgi:hypothetical protein